MKNLFILLLLFPVIGWAQGNSRIVFFRVDRWGESGDIYQNNNKIAASPLHLLYVYTTDKPSGTYFWGIRNNHLDWGATLPIVTDTNSITFVALKFVAEGGNKNLSASGASRHNMMVPVSFAEFKEYYNSNKKLKKRLKQEGYASLDDLLKGFQRPSTQE